MRRLFAFIEASDFLAGRSKDWTANFDWVLKPKNLTKIIEGQYVNEGRGGASMSPETLRVPPHSIEAEQSVIGALLLDNRVSTSSASCRRTSSTTPGTSAFRGDARRPGCWPDVRRRDGQRGVEGRRQALNYVGGLAYIGALQNAVPSSANAARYATISPRARVSCVCWRLSARKCRSWIQDRHRRRRGDRRSAGAHCGTGGARHNDRVPAVRRCAGGGRRPVNRPVAARPAWVDAQRTTLSASWAAASPAVRSSSPRDRALARRYSASRRQSRRRRGYAMRVFQRRSMPDSVAPGMLRWRRCEGKLSIRWTTEMPVAKLDR